VPATPHEQRDVRVAGLRLRHLDEGPRAPDSRPILILPGHTARIEDYDALVPLLAGERRVLLPDLPGKGYSDKPDRAYSFAFYQDVVIGFLDALGVAEVELAGGSLGGNLALRLAHRHPDRVGRVIAWGPGSAWRARPRLAAAIRAVGGYTLFWPAIRIHSSFWFRDDDPARAAALREKYAYYEEVMGPGFVRMYVDMAADSVGSSLFDLAPEIRSPVLLVRGEADRAANLEQGMQRLAELLPDAELVVIPNARHALASEAPDTLAGLIDAFLDRPSSGGAQHSR
jgi:pimeloyl-ACP methyl ester carboxylesterase